MGIQRPLTRLLESVVTCLYVGYLPLAPGTYASALAAAAIYLFPSVFGNMLFVASFVLFSMISVELYPYEGRDPGYIVIDELAGMWVTLAGHRITLLRTVIGFALFRLFDIAKPFPIRHAERVKGGAGIVADDVIAGVFASLILAVLGRYL
ncbi:MAG TPA: phosphatidylglycerophosphatase A [Syntrophorhabdaceae bacterium]|nr:phosphatidylglycerophosphatase A [Syntrophorhabdaceae bacterium]